MEISKISGTEAIHEIMGWFDRVLAKSESCIPGARAVLTSAMECRMPITHEMIEREPTK